MAEFDELAHDVQRLLRSSGGLGPNVDPLIESARLFPPVDDQPALLLVDLPASPEALAALGDDGFWSTDPDEPILARKIVQLGTLRLRVDELRKHDEGLTLILIAERPGEHHTVQPQGGNPYAA